MKKTVYFDVTSRFNPNQQSIAIYNSHIFNDRNTTIKDQLIHSKYTEFFSTGTFFLRFLLRHFFS